MFPKPSHYDTTTLDQYREGDVAESGLVLNEGLKKQLTYLDTLLKEKQDALACDLPTEPRLSRGQEI